MADPAPQDVAVRLVDDPDAGERATRLTALLATGIERWLRHRSGVDFGRDMLVHRDMDRDNDRGSR